MNLRISGAAKARLIRAAALRNTDLTRFVTDAVLREADAVIAEADRIALTERDSLRVLELLEHPPALTDRLREAVAKLPPES